MHSRVHFTASYKQLAPNAPTDAFAGTGRIGACRVCDGLFCYPLGSVEDVDVRADVTDDECVPLPPDEKYFWSYTKQYTTHKRQDCALLWLIECKRSRELIPELVAGFGSVLKLDCQCLYNMFL